MANIFTWEVQDIDLKECIKLKTNCQQSDTMILQFNIYDHDIPVDLTNFNVAFVAKKPDGSIYALTEDENITKVGNLLTITCGEQLTVVNGRVISILEITDNNGNRKSSYFIVLNVTGLINADDRVVSRNFVDILERFDNDVNIAMALSTSFKANIEDAQAIADDFALKIPQASVVDDTLNDTIDEANAIEFRLNPLYQNSKTISDKLDISIPSATTIRDELDLAKISANIEKDALITTIANVDNKLQEFKDYDTTEIVPKTNLMLNEIYCNKELLSINHGLNEYPVAKMTYTEYGGGVGGAGDFPAGADSDCNLMQNKAIYTDSNNMTIFVPLNYYIANPSINKINDYKYIVTFTNSTRSLLIELIKGTIGGDIQAINDSITSINNSISDLNYQTAQGTSNALTLVINKTLTNGYPLKFIAKYNNNGTATTINNKHFYKPNGTNPPVLVQGKAYDIWYDLGNDCFFLKANAVGNTIASHVLAGDGFSTDIDTDLTGAMPNNGGLGGTLAINGTYTIPAGYTTGGAITQSITIKTAQTYSPSTTAQIIASEQYLSGIQTISAITGTSGVSDVLATKTFSSANGISLTGTMVNRGTVVITPSTVNQPIAIGYHNGSGYVVGDADLVASNILNTANIFNIQGTANPCQKASGTVWCDVNSSVTVSLPFTPNFVAGNVTDAIVAISGFAYNDGTTSFGGGNNDGGVQLLTNGFRFSINRNSNGTVHWYAYLA